MKDHLTLLGWKEGKAASVTCGPGYGAAGALMHRRWECKMIYPRWDTIQPFPKKVKKIYSSCDPIVLKYLPKRKESPRLSTWRFLCNFIYNSPKPETLQMSINRQMDKQIAIDSFNGLLPRNKKELTTNTQQHG